MDTVYPITTLTVFLLVQGAGSLFLALVLGTLFVYRRKASYFYWTLAWLCSALWLIPDAFVRQARLADSTIDAEWLLHATTLFGWWHATLWIFSLDEFRRPGATRNKLFTWKSGVLFGLIGLLAVLVGLALPQRNLNILLACALTIIYLWSALVFTVHGRQSGRRPAYLLAATLALYGLNRLHLAALQAWAVDDRTLQIPYVSLTALADFLIQTLVACATILFLIDVEQTELHDAAQRLEESEERFRLIFEHCGVGMSLLTRDGRFFQVNPALIHMLGFSAEELRGKRFMDLVFNKDASQEGVSVTPEPDPPSFYEREKRFLRKDGETIWARVVRVPIRDAAGQARHYVGVLVDITQRKRVEEALAASELRLRQLNQVALDGIHVLDERGLFLEVNPAFCQMLGYEHDELACLTLPELGEYPAVLREYQKRIIEHGRHRLETRLCRKDGTLLDVEMAGALLALEGRNLLHGVCRDVTDRKASDEQLREATERLQEERDFSHHLLEAAGMMVYVVDAAGKIVHFNAACTAVLGYTESEVRGRPFWEVLLPERHIAAQREDHHNMVRASAKAGNELPLTYEMHWRTKEGKERLIAWRNAPVHDLHGNVRHVIATGLDVTEQRQLEEQVRQARKLESLGTLVGGIAHDFNNHLTVVLGHLGLALEDLDANAEEATRLQEALRQAEASALRCAEITQRLLTFASGKVGPSSRMAPADLLEEVAARFEREPPSNVRVTVQAPAEIWPTVGDASALLQVLLNLTANARDAMPQGGELTLTAANRILLERDCAMHAEARPGRFVEIQIADTGTGMTPEVLEHLFEPFFTTKEQGRAAGMGLAVAYGIIRAHGGWIAVKSRPGQGSVFSIYLPAAETLAPQAPAVGSTSLRGSECILVVDDEELVRRFSEAVLSRGGYQVLQANDGLEGLRIYREQGKHIDLVLLDYSMPKMNGLEVLLELQRLDPQVQVIFSSGYTRDSDSDQLLATGAGAFIAKPYRADDLLTVVREVLDKDSAPVAAQCRS